MLSLLQGYRCDFHHRRHATEGASVHKERHFRARRLSRSSLKSDRYVISEWNGIVVMRCFEIILRAAKILKCVWHSFDYYYALFEKKGMPDLGVLQSWPDYLLFAAHKAWFDAYRKAMRTGTGAFDLALPQTWMCRNSNTQQTYDLGLSTYAAAKYVNEEMPRGSAKTPRRLIANMITVDRINNQDTAGRKDYFAMVDLEKQSVAVYPGTEGEYNRMQSSLSVPNRLDGHGKFEEVRPFIFKVMDYNFVANHMILSWKRHLARTRADLAAWKAEQARKEREEGNRVLFEELLGSSDVEMEDE